MFNNMIKALLWQSIEKPKKLTDYIMIIIAWASVILIILAFNVFLEKLNLNRYLFLLLRILSIVLIPYMLPALNIATNRRDHVGGVFFRSNSVIALLIAPFYVYKYIKDNDISL